MTERVARYGMWSLRTGKRVARICVATLLAGAITVIAAPAAQAADVYDEMRQKWKATLDGGPDLNLSDASVRARVDGLSAQAQAQWSTMDTTPNTYVWPDLANVSADGHAINYTVDRLLLLAKAFSTKGTAVYGNETLCHHIITALDWVNAHWYNPSIPERGGFYEWDIGIPKRWKDTAFLMYDYLTPTQIANYSAAARSYVGDITRPGWDSGGPANRIDVLIHQLGFAVLTKDGAYLGVIRDKLSPLFDYVTTNVGFYADGSYIDHEDVAYALSYGSVALQGISNILFTLSGTQWYPTDPDIANFYHHIYRTYEPLVFRGAGMDMVRGRAVSRPGEQEHNTGNSVIADIARMSMYVPEPHRTNFRAIVKHLVTADDYLDFFTTGAAFDVLAYVRGIMADPSVPVRGEPVGHYAFNNMDRTVHRRPDWAFGISKSSRRVQNFEMMNGENGRGWYFGDGATYLYNGDQGQFSGTFWPTVNMQRIPGTTLEVRTRYADDYQNGDGEGDPPTSWSGGTVLGEYGASGLNLIPTAGRNPGSLNALKSWFMFDDEVVALGSGIKTTVKRGQRVETVVENRKLNPAGTNAFTVNGTVKPTNAGWAEDLTGVQWAHLAGSAPGSDIGYYFPGGGTVQAIRQARTGTWAALNQNVHDTTTYSATYLTMTVQHGVDPTTGAYSYVLLPDKSSTETDAYASSPDIQVLANSTNVHAARDTTIGVTGYNFWTDSSQSVDEITSNRRASVMTRETADGLYEIAVSDPTMENTGTITVDIDRQMTALVSKDTQVTVAQLAPFTRLVFNVNGAKGKSFKATLRLAPKIEFDPAALVPVMSDNFDAAAAGAAPAGWTVIKPASTNVFVDNVPSTTDKSVKFTDSTAGDRARMSRTYPATTGIAVVDWSFMEPGPISNYPYVYVSGTGGAAVNMTTGGNQLRYLSRTGLQRNVQPVAPGTWYSVRAVVDLANQRYDIYVNGQLKVVRASFYAPATNLNSIEFITGYAAPGTSYLYVDDVSAARR